MRVPGTLLAALSVAATLGAAVSLVTCPAAALDLEKVAPSLEPCPGKGPGFVRTPGSRNCTRLTGRVVAGADLRAGRQGIASAPVVAGRVAIDNRTESDLGEVRTYVRIGNGRR